MSELENINELDQLWVLFRLMGNLYAVSSSCTQGIARESDDITAVPDTKPYVRGITKLRGNVVTLIDLRTVLGMRTTEEAYKEFAGIIDKAETAHRNWVGELCRCVNERCHFHLEKDPHNCEFGRWYDRYEAPVEQVRKRLLKIREPHETLHRLGVEFDKEISRPEPRSERLASITERAKDLQKKIIAEMDSSRDAFKDNYRTMTIELLLKNQQRVALIVDEIVGVEHIGEVFSDITVEKMERSELISKVANTEDGKDLLFIIDEDEIQKLLENSTIEPEESWEA